ncbi:MAG: LCP family protein [Candidatus Avilachnospira sp.]|jgi:LCP family protein required for cell wall assembly
MNSEDYRRYNNTRGGEHKRVRRSAPTMPDERSLRRSAATHKGEPLRRGRDISSGRNKRRERYEEPGYEEYDYRDEYEDEDYEDDGYEEEEYDYYDKAQASRGRHKGGRRKKKKRRFLKLLFAVILIVAAFFVGKNILQGNNWTVAVFGVDARDGELEKGTRSDVIMVVNVNKSSGEVKLVSVFRDTYLKIDDDGNYNKINAAYERGGHEQAIKALEENLDLKIDDYITFSWSAVAKGINALGGIDLEISDAEFSYINAFITETVNSTGIGSVQLKSAGMNHLDGVQAVAYGRLRLMDTDFNRTARQRKVIGLAVDKAKAADFDTLKNTALAVLPEVSTSIGIDDLVPLLRNIDKYNIADSTGFPFSRQTMDIGRLDCVVPTTLESNVVTLHQILFGEENYEPSSTVKSISAHIGEVTGLTDAGENAPEAGTGGGIVHKDNTPAKQETAEVTEAVTETETEAETEGESESSSEGQEESLESSSEEAESSSGNEEEQETKAEHNDAKEIEGEKEESTVHERPSETVKPTESSRETEAETHGGNTAIISPDGPKPLEEVTDNGPGVSGPVEGPMGGLGV